MAILEQDLLVARQAWGEGLIAVSKKYESEGIESARKLASKMLDDLYGFALGPVLFKPTLSGGMNTFRTDKSGALSYFVGHNSQYPQDSGFGIKFWREVSSETSAIFIDGTTAMWMGWVSFKDKNGDLTKVDKSWGYKMDPNGMLKIVLHHSSLPYQG